MPTSCVGRNRKRAPSADDVLGAHCWQAVPLTCDIAIIGGGLAGLTASIALRKAVPSASVKANAVSAKSIFHRIDAPDIDQRLSAEACKAEMMRLAFCYTRVCSHAMLHALLDRRIVVLPSNVLSFGCVVLCLQQDHRQGVKQLLSLVCKVLVVHALSASAGTQPKSRGTPEPACTHHTMLDGLKTVRGLIGHAIPPRLALRRTIAASGSVPRSWT